MRRMLFRLAYCAAAIMILVVATAPFGIAQTTPVLTVDAAGNPHPINPDVYGIANYNLDAGFAKEIQVPNVRWGGDGTTRYNWQVDSSNAGFDWYFMGGNGETTATPSASADLMINTYKTASNAHTLLTIPIIPYVNKSSAWTCSFPVSVYGAQQSTNPYVHPNGDNCGNSITTAGVQLLDNNIYANHIDNTTALQQGWVQHLIATFGTAANGGVPYYQLDNEPSGWYNTHRDVMPNGAAYPEIVALGEAYAAMIKLTDPSASVLGPSDFSGRGWVGNPKQQNNLYAGQYYLQQMASYEQQHGRRILDYFDEHYYATSTDNASELASTRTLWDPTYLGPGGSVFNAPIDLIPRFKNWIQQYYPGGRSSPFPNMVSAVGAIRSSMRSPKRTRWESLAGKDWTSQICGRFPCRPRRCYAHFGFSAIMTARAGSTAMFRSSQPAATRDAFQYMARCVQATMRSRCW